jgi:threonine/homoserine/homoserine lactone efflux protein
VIDPSALWLFVPASLLLIVAPGPDILFLVTQGTSNGSRAGFLTALGLATGNLVHTLGAALGVSVLFQTSELAFQALKFAGVARCPPRRAKRGRVVPDRRRRERMAVVAKGA